MQPVRSCDAAYVVVERGQIGLLRSSPTRSTKLSRGGADLVASHLVRGLEALLPSILTENAGRFKSALEATVELLERLTLSGIHEHAGSFSGPL